MRVPFSFLTEQFGDPEPIFNRIREFLKRCDFTLGEDLMEFENKYAKYTGAKHAIGVGTGTDALSLGLRMAGVKPGDEVITPPNSFFATTGAIVQAGAKPVFVDVKEDQTIDPKKIEVAISAKTTAILPVHWAGCPADMESICEIANQHKLVVVEDACQALGAKIGNKHVGTFGTTGGFSCHPLKPLHVWGDGGMVITNNDAIAEELRLYRNHGCESRDVIRFWGINSRFDNLHAIVGNYVFETLDDTIDKRIAFAGAYDKAFATERFQKHLEVPSRDPNKKHVYHLYKVNAERRGELLEFLKGQGIEAKIHYPVPLHLQPAAKIWDYKDGDFPETERESRETITFPCHQYLQQEHIDYVIEKVAEFYGV